MAGKFLFFILVLFVCNHVHSLRLKQVLVLSRHNLRTPLTATLVRMTPKMWPKWNTEVGYLTEKGALLESYMAEYFSEWLNEKGLLTERCPEEKNVHIYANTRQRTKATAIAFTEAAFKDCNITVHFKNTTEMDPIFNPVVHNTTDTIKQIYKQEMAEKLKNSDLKDVYVYLNKITDIGNSAICKEEGYCDLTKDGHEIVLKVGEEPNINGPLFIANCMVDSFLMSYYEGMPMEDIAWGEIKNDDHWRLLTKATVQNQNVRFNLTTAARDVTKPLLEYMKERFLGDTEFTLLVGHDSNLSPVISCMDFKPFTLPEQFERTPIGGKLVFQKWTDGTEDFLKVEFVYQSTLQLRNAEKLTMTNPPKNITMYLKSCVANEHGLCPWSDFEQLLNNLVQ